MEKKRRVNEFGMPVMTVDEVIKESREHPERFPQIDPADRRKSRCDAWDELSIYDSNKRLIMSYREGDKFENMVGRRYILKEITEHELIFYPMDGGNELEIHLKDGTVDTINWNDRSRSEAWTDEMKSKARAKAFIQNESRGGNQRWQKSK